MTVAAPLKPVFWIGNTKAELSALAEDVRDEVGQALFEAQRGSRHPSAKPLSGYGDAGVLEIVSDHRGDTFRAVYTVRWPTGIYVLHVFQKKSKTGIRTPKADLALIDSRLQRLKQLARGGSTAQLGDETMSDDEFRIEAGSGNVFADLGLPDAEERLTKADLAIQIKEAIGARRLTQGKAAALLGIDQPKISRLLRGQLSGFSTERLIQFLTLLGQDVMIVVRPAARSTGGIGQVSVVAEPRPG